MHQWVSLHFFSQQMMCYSNLRSTRRLPYIKGMRSPKRPGEGVVRLFTFFLTLVYCIHCEMQSLIQLLQFEAIVKAPMTATGAGPALAA